MAKKPVAKSASDDPYIAIGKTAPAITLNDQDSAAQKLKDHLGKWVVVYFYPKDNTSGCTKQACAFRDDQSKFDKVGAVVLGISPDDEKSHTKFIAKYDLPFSLLADTQKTICEKYGVWQEKNNYGRKYMGVVRTTYLIDPKGKVAHCWKKVKVAGHSDEVLARIRELKSQ